MTELKLSLEKIEIHLGKEDERKDIGM